MKALVLVGPTAVGKTDLSFEIAAGHAEIVSADSVQIYKYFDIGSGKPDREQRAVLPHHLIDVADPDYSYTAGDYCRDALHACEKIAAKGKIPFFVGGTGLYIDSFFDGLSDIPRVDISVRNVLLNELQEHGLQSLYERLLQVDRKFAESIHKNDRQRILRGLEVYIGTGEPLSSYYGEKNGQGSDETVYVGLMDDADSLHKRIERRVDAMIGRGLIDEVVYIRSLGYGPVLKSMKSIGYHEINEYIDGKMGLQESIEGIKSNTKKYAKRQMTWFKKNKRIHWFHVSRNREVVEFLKRTIDQF